MTARVVAVVSLVLSAAAIALDPGSEDIIIWPIAPAFALVGALIATKRPENRVGWLYLAFGAIASLVFCTYSYARRTLILDPGSLPGADIAVYLSAHVWHASFGLLLLSLLLFPNGRLLSSRWRPVALASIALSVGMLVSGLFESEYSKSLFPTATPVIESPLEEVANEAFSWLLGITALSLLAGPVALLLRLRSSRGEERQQVKWFVYTVTLLVLVTPVGLILTDTAWGIVLFPLIPVSAAIGILRHRLYDIDLVIKRTLIYGTLTAVLGGAYVGSVLLLQLLLSPSSDLAIAGSTLAVAALFRPAQARIQQLVNRRFYRSEYDAQRTVEAFGARLRDELSLDALTTELQAVVQDTMKPAHVTVWLR